MTSDDSRQTTRTKRIAFELRQAVIHNGVDLAKRPGEFAAAFYSDGDELVGVSMQGLDQAHRRCLGAAGDEF